MYKITIEATTEKDKEGLTALAQEVCYHLNEELNVRISQDFKWDGRSSGDDGYFELSDKAIKVITKGKSCTKG